MKRDGSSTCYCTQHAEITIQLGGRDVPVRYYAVEGSSPMNKQKSEAAVLFVHGLRDRALYFERIARCFASLGYRTFLLELPGYDARSWGAPINLDAYTIAVYAQYLYRSIEALEIKHRVNRYDWIIWGQSMGGAIVYRAMARQPAIFRQVDRIVLDAPAFANRLTFGSKFTIWLSKLLHSSGVGRAIGRKLIGAYFVKEQFSPEVVSYKPREIEGFADSYSVFHQCTVSLKQPDNNFDLKVLQEVGAERLLWVWSPNDQAVHATPPRVIPAEQQIRLTAGHTASLVVPEEVCQQVYQRIKP